MAGPAKLNRTHSSNESRNRHQQGDTPGMAIDWEHWVGEVIDSTFPLHRFIEGTETTAAFLTGFRGEKQLRKAVIKVFCLPSAARRAMLTRWDRTAGLVHSNLLDLFATGEDRLDGMDFVYMVTEFPDESLTEVIPDRALTAEEAKQFLVPALQALAFLQGKGFAHTAVKPANLFAVQDTLKLSRDSISPMGDPVTVDLIYPPPEQISQGASSTGDIWGIGITLVHVLTQQPPQTTGAGPAIPDTLPAPFPELVRSCLANEPSRRPTAVQLAKAAASRSGKLRNRKSWSTARIFQTAAIAAAGVVVAGVVARPWLMPNEPTVIGPPAQRAQLGKSAPPSTEPSAAGQQSGPGTEAKTAETPAQRRKRDREEARQRKARQKEEARQRLLQQKEEARLRDAQQKQEGAAKREADQRTQADARKQEARPQLEAQKKTARKEDPPPREARNEPTAGNQTKPAPPGEVARQVLPEVLAQARRTIQGKVAVSIRVRANAAGDVVNASIDDRGPSWYFADLALESSKSWKFAPASGTEAREWVIQYQFLRTETKASPRRVTLAQ